MKKSLLLLAIILASFTGRSQAGPDMTICLATVDTMSTHNIVVWERATQTSLNGFDSVKIYRNGIIQADTLLATVHWDSLSQYEDYDADPNLRSYVYKISGVDTLGIEGPMSDAHKTIHFGIIEQGDSIHLLWTPYQGMPVVHYNCWADSTGSGTWDSIFETPGPLDTNWWHKTTPQDWSNLEYLVDCDMTSSCTSTKAQDHNTTRSNRSTTTGGGPGGPSSARYTESIHFVSAFPNPSQDIFNLQFSSSTHSPILVRVVDLTGKEIKSFSPFRLSGQYTMQVDLTRYDGGYYNILIETDNKIYSKGIIKL